jgi:hypothetical protein
VRVRVGIRDRRWLSEKRSATSLRASKDSRDCAYRRKSLTTISWVQIIRKWSWSRLHPDKLHIGEERREEGGRGEPYRGGTAVGVDELLLILG